MTAKHPKPNVPDEGVLAAHAHRVGDIGSGKQSSLPAEPDLYNGDGCGPGYFQSVTLDNLTDFSAECGDAPRPHGPAESEHSR